MFSYEKLRSAVSFLKKWLQISVFIYISQKKHLILCILKSLTKYGWRFYIQNKAFVTYQAIDIDFYLMEKSVELLKAAAKVDDHNIPC